MSNKKGLLVLSPLIALIVLGSFIIAGGGYRAPITVAFMIPSIYAISISEKTSLSKRIEIFSRDSGAGSSNLILMPWIYVFASVFVALTMEMGNIDATANMSFRVLLPNMLLSGMFFAICFISISIDTSVATIVSHVPIATSFTQVIRWIL